MKPRMSARTCRGGGVLEHVFDIVPPEPEALRGADDEAVVVVAAIEEWNRIEAAAECPAVGCDRGADSRRCDRRASGRRGPVTGGTSAAAESPPRSAPAQEGLQSDAARRDAAPPAAPGRGAVSGRHGQLPGDLGDQLAHATSSTTTSRWRRSTPRWPSGPRPGVSSRITSSSRPSTSGCAATTPMRCAAPGSARAAETSMSAMKRRIRHHRGVGTAVCHRRPRTASPADGYGTRRVR